MLPLPPVAELVLRCAMEKRQADAGRHHCKCGQLKRSYWPVVESFSMHPQSVRREIEVSYARTTMVAWAEVWISGGEETTANQRRALSYHSEMNGRAEVTNKLVTEKARKMMIAGNVDKSLWPEAVTAAALMLNLTPSIALGGDSPYSALARAQHSIGQKDWPLQPNFFNMRAYGCTAYIRDEGVSRGDKFEPRAIVGQLVGYEPGSRTIFRVFTKDKVVRTTNITLNENDFSVGTAPGDDDFFDLPVPSGGELSDESISLKSSASQTQSRIQLDDADIIESEPESEPEPEPELEPRPELGAQRRSTRISRPSQRAREARAKPVTALTVPRRVHRAFLAGVLSQQTPQSIRIPTTYEDAMSTPEAAHWHEAMPTEIQCLKEHNVSSLKGLQSFKDAGSTQSNSMSTAESLVTRPAG